MINIPGQLTIRTVHGRYGDFNVGRLLTSIGEFTVKNAELDQYREGKFEGDFVIDEIKPSTYSTNGRTVIEIRAYLGGMTLSNVDLLSTDEAQRLSPQEFDPIDEEMPVTIAVPAKAPAKARKTKVASDPLIDTTPFGVSTPVTAAAKASEDEEDAALFGTLWPLSDTFKLDATVNRLTLRQQIARLGELGYEFNELTQDWHLTRT
jgi:hypothetical protein